MEHGLPRECNFTEDEKRQIEEWNEDHDKRCLILKNHKDDEWTPPFGAIGGSRSYTFTPTSIGTIMTIECACGEEFVIDNNL